MQEFYDSQQIFQSNYLRKETVICEFHPGYQCQAVCVSNHKCRRKLCSICQYEHQSELNQIIPYEIFAQKLQEKCKAINFEDDSLLQDSKTYFKHVLSQMEFQFKQIIEDVRYSINNVYELIEKKNQEYSQLLQNSQNLMFCSNTNLNYLINIYSGTLLEDWNNLKKNSLNQIDQINQQVEKALLEKVLKKNNQLMEDVVKTLITLEETLGKNQFRNTFNWEEMRTKEKAVCFQLNTFFFNVHEYKQSSIEIEYSKECEIKYIKNGEIFKIEKVFDTSQKPQIIKNFEQIKFLNWKGQYNKKKIGTWTAFWKDQAIDAGGQYNNEGLKDGSWKELFDNYWESSKVIYVGQYQNGIKQGYWEAQYKEDENQNYKKIGGGEYNIMNGKKIGKWIDLYQYFYKFCQVYFVGNYQNGWPIGKWDIIYKDKTIGGGEYDERGQKIGRWKELDKNFWDYSQILKEGCYQKGRKRCGRWDTIYKGKIIGGGTYDDKGDKNGEWTDLYQNFWDNCQITYVGLYKNGIKIGRWNTIFENKLIGGGIYDNNGMKNEKWTEIHKAFKIQYNILYNGVYKNGTKVGKWNIEFQLKTIGGGKFNQNGKKIEKWIDLHENYGENCQIVYVGDYKVGIKVGNWNVLHKNTKLGGGFYKENGMKDGKWIDVVEGFDDKALLRRKIYHQEYRDGLKVGPKQEILLENKNL